MENTKYFTAAETAKLIREQFKKHFPGQKFYVRSETYSGGASIDIDWMDGPTEQAVDRIIAAFNGAEFDGMGDIKLYSSAWLLPDGSAVFQEYQAQEHGHVTMTAKPHPDAIPCRFSADFIFTNRRMTTDNARAVIDKVMAQHPGEVGPELEVTAFWHNGKPTEIMVCHPDFMGDNWQAWRDDGDKGWLKREISEALKNADFYQRPQQAAPAPVTIARNFDGKLTVTVTYDRDWTWIRFPEKPADDVLDLMRNVIKARYSQKRQAWYVTETIDETTIRVQIAA